MTKCLVTDLLHHLSVVYPLHWVNGGIIIIAVHQYNFKGCRMRSEWSTWEPLVSEHAWELAQDPAWSWSWSQWLWWSWGTAPWCAARPGTGARGRRWAWPCASSMICHHDGDWVWLRLPRECGEWEACGLLLVPSSAPASPSCPPK